MSLISVIDTAYSMWQARDVGNSINEFFLEKGMPEFLLYIIGFIVVFLVGPFLLLHHIYVIIKDKIKPPSDENIQN